MSGSPARLDGVKIHSLAIDNLRAIRHFEVTDLPDFVVVAGANGSGKSCVFDAIRLLKSVYGGYQANEYQQWFGEFAINLQDPQDLRKLFRDQTRAITIDATISFAATEIEYLAANVETLALPVAWQEVTGQPVDYWSWNRITFATQLRSHQQELQNAVARLSTDVRAALTSPRQRVALTILPTGEMSIAECKPAEVAFQAYEPEHLGVIEYHSASRTYARQQVGGITLDTRAFEDQRRQQRLYNWQTKYQNVKTQLSSSYLRGIITRESGQLDTAEDLNSTMQELFRTFFPDKTYEGVRPQPHGGLEFPVRLTSGEVHDIDELSSGEKEILYGYLQLRNSTPRHSVILLDEPELHLNPSLLQGFTDFYYRHLGLSQGNQLWLVTHSDTLLRQAVGNCNYRVYQMVSATAQEVGANQAVEVVADDDVERVTISLVGDLASYRPHGKVVILEGRAEHGFDVTMVKRLFPDFARRVNLVSGGHRQRVRDLYSALESAATQAGIRNRFFAVVDKDAFPERPASPSTAEFTWNAYHIENYLLDFGSIRAATNGLLGRVRFDDDEEVVSVLRECAEEILDRLVLERLQASVNERFLTAVAVKGPPDTKAPARDLLPSISASASRIGDLAEQLTIDTLECQAAEYRSVLATSLADDSWLKEFPGRLVLRRYADRVLGGKIDSMMFSNAVLDKMVEREVKPPGMQQILDEIAAR